MSILGDVLSGRLRQEMRQRVDEVLKCGNEWSQAARDLIEALNRLTDSIKKGNPDPSIPKSVVRASRKLAKETARLTRAFEAHNKTLSEILRRYG